MTHCFIKNRYELPAGMSQRRNNDAFTKRRNLKYAETRDRTCRVRRDMIGACNKKSSTCNLRTGIQMATILCMQKEDYQ
jgi:hypothetical protein